EFELLQKTVNMRSPAAPRSDDI
ncbi:unnamed protein product, partial [Fusarium graminearum]